MTEAAIKLQLRIHAWVWAFMAVFIVVGQAFHIQKNRDVNLSYRIALTSAANKIDEAQAEGVPVDLVEKIAGRIYARPPGKLAQEIGGLAITLDALAENAGLNVNEEADRELARVLSLPKDWWARKHAEKVAAGVADLSVSKSVSGD